MMGQSNRQTVSPALCVVAVATSPMKGTVKVPVDAVRLVRAWGVEGDAHAGPGPRQVSLLGWPSIRTMEERFGEHLGFGRFGENVVVDGSLEGVALGDIIALGPAVLEVTAIGKDCHNGCAIRAKTGDCIMPREGVFGRVVTGGVVRAGDRVKIVRPSRDLAVVVLAGGHSRRFGSDKRFARLPSGRTLLEVALDTARAVASEVVLSVARGELFSGIADVQVVCDEVADSGPLGGIVSSLRVCRAHWVAVFAVDQPGVTPDWLRVLAARAEEAGACWKRGDELHPLPCVLSRDRLTRLEDSLSAGDLALHRVWKKVGLATLEITTVEDLGKPDCLLANWNKPADATTTGS